MSRARNALVVGLVLAAALASCEDPHAADDPGASGSSRATKDAGSLADSEVPAADAGSSDAAVDAVDAADAREASPVDAAEAGAADAGADARDAAVGKVVINELFVNDALSKRYVEIAGPPGTPLSELRLRVVGAGGVVLKTVGVASVPSDVLPASGLWVVGGGLEPAVDNPLIASEWDLPTQNACVQLVHLVGGTAVLLDVVGYGLPPSAAQTMPTACVEGSPAPNPGAGALVRKPGLTDTNMNSADFCQGPKSPRAPNTCAP